MWFFRKLFRGLFSLILSVIILAGIFAALMITWAPQNPRQYDAEDYMVKDEYKKKVILDCDNSFGSFWQVDDGLALSYLINKPEVELLGVTTTFGVKTYNHKYTTMMIEELGIEHLPAYKGAQSSTQGTTKAAQFIAEQVAKYPGEVTIISTGPSSNIAKAAEINSDFYDDVKEIVIMGGFIKDLTLGNREIDELNISSDSIASYDVIASGAKVTIMTAQACLDARFYFTDLRKLENYPIKWKFFILFWTSIQKISTGNDYFVMWDLLPTVYAVHPEYFEDNLVHVDSSLKDLENGIIIITDDESAPAVNLPEGIVDIDAFYNDIYTQWNKIGR